MNSSPYNLIIIGSGPAGLTAALYAARAHLEPLIIEGDNPGGQLMRTSYVENWPGDKSVLGPELMSRMKEHAAYFGTQYRAESIKTVDFSQRPFRLWTSKDTLLLAKSVIIATGASPITLQCPGEQEYWGKGVSICAVCDGAFFKNKRVVIVGGGNTALEEALFLQRYTKHITIVQLKERLTASPYLADRVINNENVTILYESTVTRITGNEKQLTHITISDNKNSKSYELPTDGLFIAIGLTPNTEVFKGHIDLNPQNYILAKNMVETSVLGVFVAGDAFDFRYRQAITAAGSGCMAALEAERYLSHTK